MTMTNELHRAAQLIADALMDQEDKYGDDELFQAVDTLRAALPVDQPSEQALALARLIANRPNEGALVRPQPDDAFTLAGYWLVTFKPSGFECGIDRDGRVSS